MWDKMTEEILKSPEQGGGRAIQCHSAAVNTSLGGDVLMLGSCLQICLLGGCLVCFGLR